MKKITYFAVCLAMLTLGSCGGGENKKTGSNDSLSAKAVRGPVPELNEHREMNYDKRLGGHDYKITISIDADKSLPIVKDQSGAEYIDNTVTVSITRDGEDFFLEKFTKEAFADYLSEEANAGYILNGMNFYEEKTSGGHICLSAQVGEPGVGEGPAFIVDIPTGGGACSILRDSEQDTNGQLR